MGRNSTFDTARLVRYGLAVIAAGLVSASTVASAEEGSAWSVQSADAQNTLQADGPAPPKPGARWFVDLAEVETSQAPEGYSVSTPAGGTVTRPILGPDGTIILQARNEADREERLIGLDSETGDIRWVADEWRAPWNGSCGPALDSQGRLWARDKWGSAIGAIDPATGELDEASVLEVSDDQVICGGTTMHIGGEPERIVGFGSLAITGYGIDGDAPEVLWEHNADDPDAPFDGLRWHSPQKRVGVFSDSSIFVPAEVHDAEGNVTAIEVLELDLEDGEPRGRAELEMFPDDDGDLSLSDVLRVRLLVADDTLVAGVQMRGGAVGSGDGSLSAFDIDGDLPSDPRWVRRMEGTEGPDELVLGDGFVATQPLKNGEWRLLAYDLEDGERSTLMEEAVIGEGPGSTFEAIGHADGTVMVNLVDGRDDSVDRQVGLVDGQGGVAVRWLFNRREIEQQLGLDPGTFDDAGTLRLGPADGNGMFLVGRDTQLAAIDRTGGLGLSPETDGARVQDLILVESMRTLDDDAEPVEITEEILDDLREAAGEPVSLVGDVSFAPVSGHDPTAVDRNGVPRDDVDVQVGILSSGDTEVMAILGTPRHDTFIRTDDRLEVDLDESVLQPGDPLFVDHGFVQLLPANDDSQSEIPPLELLVERLEAGSVNVFAVPSDQGRTIGLLENQVWRTFEGSLTAGGRWKAEPLLNGLFDGASDARKKVRGGLPVAAAKDLLDDIEEGADESFDRIYNDGDLGDNQGCEDPPCDDGGGSPPTLDCEEECTRTTCEPHLQTFDGVPYDMQAVGEFVAASTDGLEVQMRTRQVGDHPVSVTSGVAVGFEGRRITVTAPPRDRPAPQWSPVRVDGEVVPLVELEAEPMEIEGGELVFYGHVLQITTPDGHLVSIRGVGGGDGWNPDDDMRRAAAESLHMWMSEGEDVEWRGLFGTGDGDPETDFTARNGEIVGPDPDFDALYDEFVDGWRVGQDESLFEYREGESTETFTDRSIPSEEITVESLPEDERAYAEAVCEESGIVDETILEDCILDYALTGDIQYVAVHRQADTIEGYRTGRIRKVGEYSPPEEPVEDSDKGCGCSGASGSTGPGALFFAVLVLLGVRRWTAESNAGEDARGSE